MNSAQCVNLIGLRFLFFRLFVHRENISINYFQLNFVYLDGSTALRTLRVIHQILIRFRVSEKKIPCSSKTDNIVEGIEKLKNIASKPDDEMTLDLNFLLFTLANHAKY